ncbi:sugar transporter [Gautieria morchelliformis]|nr:sugar transporter [Gautieria morchelliformis]
MAAGSADKLSATSPDIEKPKSGGLAALTSVKGIDVRQLNVEYAINEEDPDEEFGGTEERARMEKQLLRKLDMRFAIVCLMCILNFIDRTAVSARLQGFEKDLKLTGQQFQTVIAILYIGYVPMQVPSNILLNYTAKPSLYIPTAMVLWGMLSILTGIAHDFKGALVVRLFLGTMEAAFYPGVVFVLSKWYTRRELGLRVMLLFTGNITSNAFGGLLSAAILTDLNGKLGVAGWRYLFYIEVFVAICAIFILPDFPASTKWITPLERRLAEVRMAEEVAGAFDEGNSRGGLALAVRDWCVWWLAVAFFAMIVGLSSLQNFFPTLTATLGFSTTVTFLLIAPPWLFAAVVSFFVARSSDKTGERFLHIAIPNLLGMLGFVIAMSTMSLVARYISLFLMAISTAADIVIMTWISNIIPRPPAKRAAAIAIVNSFSQAAGIPSSYIFPSMWGPTYRNSFAICTAAYGVNILMCLVLRQYLASENKRLDEVEGAIVQSIERKADRKIKPFRYLY